MTVAHPHARRPRERILSAACELFHRHGIRGVGVETIAEAAGTNKMTLYRHFDSKDDLILEYLRCIAADVDAMWVDMERRYPDDKKAQLKLWLARAEDCINADGRGCDLANAAVELTEDAHPARKLIEELKSEQRNRLARLCRRAGLSKPGVVADTLTLLLEGARVSRQAAGTNGPCAKFVSTAEKVIAAFRAKPKADGKTVPGRRSKQADHVALVR